MPKNATTSPLKVSRVAAPWIGGSPVLTSLTVAAGRDAADDFELRTKVPPRRSHRGGSCSNGAVLHKKLSLVI